MESADLVIVLVVVAIGAFAGGILFGMWLVKRNQPKPQAFHASVARMNAVVDKVMEEEAPRIPNLRPKQAQTTASNRIGWPALRRELEEDDPEAKRYEEIVKANGGN